MTEAGTMNREKKQRGELRDGRREERKGGRKKGEKKVRGEGGREGGRDDRTLSPVGGMSQIEALMLLGIHSTKLDEFLFTTCDICTSISRAEILPRNMQAQVRYL